MLNYILLDLFFPVPYFYPPNNKTNSQHNKNAEVIDVIQPRQHRPLELQIFAVNYKYLQYVLILGSLHLLKLHLSHRLRKTDRREMFPLSQCCNAMIYDRFSKMCAGLSRQHLLDIRSHRAQMVSWVFHKSLKVNLSP